MFGFDFGWRSLVLVTFLVLFNGDYAHSLLRNGSPAPRADEQDDAFQFLSASEENLNIPRNPAFNGIPDSVFEKYFEKVLAKSFKSEYLARKKELQPNRRILFRSEPDFRQPRLSSFPKPTPLTRHSTGVSPQVNKKLTESLESVLVRALTSAFRQQSQADQAQTEFPDKPSLPTPEIESVNQYTFPGRERVIQGVASAEDLKRFLVEDEIYYENMLNRLQQREKAAPTPPPRPIFPFRSLPSPPDLFDGMDRRSRPTPETMYFPGFYGPPVPKSSVNIYPNVAAFHIAADERNRNINNRFPLITKHRAVFTDGHPHIPYKSHFRMPLRSGPPPAVVKFHSESVKDMPEDFGRAVMDVMKGRTRPVPPEDDSLERISEDDRPRLLPRPFMQHRSPPQRRHFFPRPMQHQTRPGQQRHFIPRFPYRPSPSWVNTRFPKPKPHHFNKYHHPSWVLESEEVLLPSEPVAIFSTSSSSESEDEISMKLAQQIFKREFEQAPDYRYPSNVETKSLQPQEVVSSPEPDNTTPPPGPGDHDQGPLEPYTTESPSSEEDEVTVVSVPDPLAYVQKAIKNFGGTRSKPLNVRVLPKKLISMEKAGKIETGTPLTNHGVNTESFQTPPDVKVDSIVSPVLTDSTLVTKTRNQDNANANTQVFDSIGFQQLSGQSTAAQAKDTQVKEYLNSFPPELVNPKDAAHAFGSTKQTQSSITEEQFPEPMTASRKVKRQSETMPQTLEETQGGEDRRVTTLSMLDGDSKIFEEIPRNRRRSFPCSVNTAVGRAACERICQQESMAVQCAGPYCNCFQDSRNRDADTERNSAKCGPNTNFGRAGCRLICDGVDDLMTCTEMNCYCNRHKNVNKGNPQLDGMGRLTTAVLGQFFYCGPANGINQCSDICRGWGHVSCGELSCYCDRGGS